MNDALPPRFVILAILDGWGLATPGPGNAIDLANTPYMDSLMLSYPHTKLSASGQAVGLPRGEDGNTETGHLNIGAGMIVYQDLERINMAVAEGSFFSNEVLVGAFDHAKKNNSDLHIMGLMGAGGVHSNIHHMFALIQMARRENFDRLFLHLFTDGRDSPPTAAKTYINQIKKVIQTEQVGEIASMMGRYWAMDRDQRWDRTARAYFALTKGEGEFVSSVDEAINESYSQGKTDEFIEPTLVVGKNGKPKALIKDNDAVIFFNYRIDRPRQLSKAFMFDDFSKAGTSFDFDPHSVRYTKSHTAHQIKSRNLFERGEKKNNLYFATMTQYGKPIVDAGAKVAFSPVPVEMPLGKVLSENKFKQLRITESEKERFVTFYFNGLREEPFDLEKRIIIPSPSVSTYDQKPEMSSQQLTETLLNELGTFEHSVIIINYPNVDMVGHTGNIGPTVKAAEVVDVCIGRIINFVLAYNGALLITADHGNAEEMINNTSGQIDTEHSANPVPFVAVSKRLMGKPVILTDGILADIAPTILSMSGIPVPKEMTGRDLLQKVWKP